jgi:hypothetical protein
VGLHPVDRRQFPRLELLPHRGRGLVQRRVLRHDPGVFEHALDVAVFQLINGRVCVRQHDVRSNPAEDVARAALAISARPDAPRVVMLLESAVGEQGESWKPCV